MGTEDFLLSREHLRSRLEDRRLTIADHYAERKSSSLFSSIPFWMRLAATTVLPRAMSGFWPKALLTAAPLVASILRKGVSPAPQKGLLSLVKSLFSRF